MTHLPPPGLLAYIPRFVPTENMARCPQCKQLGARMLEWETASVWALCDRCGYRHLGVQAARKAPLHLADILSHLEEAAKGAPSRYTRKLAARHLVALVAAMQPYAEAQRRVATSPPTARTLRRAVKAFGTVENFADFFGLSADEVRVALLDDERACVLRVWQYLDPKQKEENNGHL